MGEGNNNSSERIQIEIIHNMSIQPISSIDPTEYTQRVVFGGDENSGTLSTSDDYNDHIRDAISPAPPAFEYDMVDYLTNGAGRYATPSVFPFVDKFFDLDISNPQTGLTTNQTYNFNEIRDAINADPGTENYNQRADTEIDI